MPNCICWLAISSCKCGHLLRSEIPIYYLPNCCSQTSLSASGTVLSYSTFQSCPAVPWHFPPESCILLSQLFISHVPHFWWIRNSIFFFNVYPNLVVFGFVSFFGSGQCLLISLVMSAPKERKSENRCILCSDCWSAHPNATWLRGGGQIHRALTGKGKADSQGFSQNLYKSQEEKFKSTEG